MADPPGQEIRFCTAADGVQLACAVSGSGAPLVKSAHWLTHLGHDWSSPIWRHQHLGLSRHFRLQRYDQRGCGLSDRDVEVMSLQAWVGDLEAVVDSAGLEQFVLLGMSQGGPISMEYAARHPERVSRLVLFGSYVRGRRLWDEGGEPSREAEALESLIRLGWARENPAYRQVFSSLFIPGASPELTREFNELQRGSASAETAARIVSVIDHLDVTATARRLKVPTLVMHCEDDARIPFSEGRRLAGEIPGARFVPLAGRNHIMLEGEPAWATRPSQTGCTCRQRPCATTSAASSTSSAYRAGARPSSPPAAPAWASPAPSVDPRWDRDVCPVPGRRIPTKSGAPASLQAFRTAPEYARDNPTNSRP